ncbi:MAG: glycosyltransferase family 2 protein [Candidatus Omnitrophota bacterium]|nr:glycosyltransferase family 2 protein [Candidatus Omnitrophota bacterium]
MKVTLIVPTLNEIDGMKIIMPRIKKEWCDQILILDGGSVDGTLEYAREQGYEIYIQKQNGFRHAYIEALSLIKGDIVITFSPDGNSIPELIPDLIKKMEEGYDMVIVSRYFKGAKSQDDDPITAFGNWLFTNTVNFLYKAHYTDVMVIYRAYKTQLIYDLALNEDKSYVVPETLFRCCLSWEPLLSVRAAKRKLKVGEMSGDEPPRIGGVRKLKIWKWGAGYYFQFFRELFFWR